MEYKKCHQDLIDRMWAITRNKSLTWDEKRKAADTLELETYIYIRCGEKGALRAYDCLQEPRRSWQGRQNC